MNVEKMFNCKIKIGTGQMVSGNDLFCLVYIDDVIIGEIFIDYKADKRIILYDIEYQEDFEYDEKNLKEIPMYELVFNGQLVNFLKKILNEKYISINDKKNTKSEKLILKIFYSCIEEMLEERWYYA